MFEWLLGWLRGLFRKNSTPVFRSVPVKDAAKLAEAHAEGGFMAPWSSGDFEAMLADRSIVADGVYVGRSGGTLAGFVVSRVAADEAEILSIVIRKRFRKSGFGSRLMRFHQQKLVSRRIVSLFLEVEEGNMPALALYQRLGFERIGQRDAYYHKADGSTATAIVMKRSLQ
jgi:ribosomal-protein-alanine N-acetyltransferase